MPVGVGGQDPPAGGATIPSDLFVAYYPLEDYDKR